MYEDLLKQVENLIIKNIGCYRDQFQKDLSVFSESLKKEYEAIKANIQGSIENVLVKFEQKLKEKQIENSQQIISEVKKAIWDDISKYLQEEKATRKLEQLSLKTNIEKTEAQLNELIKIAANLQTQISDLKNTKLDKNLLNANIKQHVNDNIEDYRKQLISSFFKTKKK